jgi:uncharacterized membrane protein YkvI
MTSTRLAWFARILLPGVVLQSVIVGGAYGTGREVVQWVTSQGPSGGFLAILVMGAAMAVVLSLCYETAWHHGAHDYRSFFRLLLGRAWWLYEIMFVLGLVLVLAIGGAAAGEILRDRFGWSPLLGIAIMFLITVCLNYLGRTWVDRTLAAWGILMSVLLIALLLLVLYRSFPVIVGTLAETGFAATASLGSGLRFFLYSVFIVPPTLFAAMGLQSRRECWFAGVIAGTLVTLPALAYHVAFLSEYPSVLAQPLPTYWLLQQLAIPLLLTVYTVVLFITIAQTGVGILQGLNERLDRWSLERRGRALPAAVHAATAGGALLASLLLAKLGIVTLVAKGYGSFAWLSLALFVLPLLGFVARSRRS